MTFLPIVERELRLKARKNRTVSRCGMAAIAVLMSFGFISVSFNAGRNPAEIGQGLFWSCAAVAFVFTVLAGPLLTADCISEEKRQGTLGLLFLTDLSGADVVLGKLVAASLPAFYALIAAIPVLALPFFLGGVTAAEFWRMTTLLLSTLLYSLSISICISTINQDGRTAFLAALATFCALGVVPLIGTFGLLGSGNFWSHFLALFPAPGPLFFQVKGRFAAGGSEFGSSLLLLCFLSAAFLAVACLMVTRAWKEGGASNGFSQSHSGTGPTKRRWHIGDRSARKEKLLAENPVWWLAERTTLHSWITHTFWVVAILLWLAGYSAVRQRSIPLLHVFACVYALHALVKCWIAWEASRRFAEDKRSGALELLLTTPLGSRRILSGWLMGLRRRFLGPVAMLFALDAHLWWSSNSGQWLLGMIATIGLFVADAYTLCWVGLWMGLVSKTSVHAFAHSVARVLALPWLVFLLVLALWANVAGESQFPPGPTALVIVGFLVGYVMDFGLCAWSIHKLSDDFRARAARQFEPQTPAAKRTFLKPESFLWLLVRRLRQWNSSKMG